MIRQVLNCFNASLFAEIALLLFATIFVAVVIRTLLTRNEVTSRGTGTEVHQAACTALAATSDAESRRKKGTSFLAIRWWIRPQCD